MLVETERYSAKNTLAGDLHYGHWLDADAVLWKDMSCTMAHGIWNASWGTITMFCRATFTIRADGFGEGRAIAVVQSQSL